jgi:ferredoxin-type protein NapH
MTLLFRRRLCQSGTALAFILIPLLNLRDITAFSGNFLSFDLAGLPLADPLAVLQTFAAGIPPAASLVGAGAALLIALVLGRVFCSWICPYGFFSELAHALRAKRGPVRAAFLPHGACAPPGDPKRTLLRAVAGRFLVTSAGLSAVLLYLPEPFLNQLSMPGWYSRALQHGVFAGSLLYGSLALPCALLLEGVGGRRFWCRNVCPQSALISLMAAFPFGLKVRFSRSKCSCRRDNRRCRAACPLDLDPRAQSALLRMACTNCGDCVTACRRCGKALRLAFADGAGQARNR